MALEIGKLLIRLAADASGVKAGVDDAQKELKKVQGAAQETRDIMKRAFAFEVIAGQLGQLGGALGKLESQWAKTASDVATHASGAAQAWGQGGPVGLAVYGLFAPLKALADEFGAVEAEAKRSADAIAQGRNASREAIDAEKRALADVEQQIKDVTRARAEGISEQRAALMNRADALGAQLVTTSQAAARNRASGLNTETLDRSVAELAARLGTIQGLLNLEETDAAKPKASAAASTPRATAYDAAVFRQRLAMSQAGSGDPYSAAEHAQAAAERLADLAKAADDVAKADRARVVAEEAAWRDEHAASMAISRERITAEQEAIRVTRQMTKEFEAAEARSAALAQGVETVGGGKFLAVGKALKAGYDEAKNAIPDQIGEGETSMGFGDTMSNVAAGASAGGIWGALIALVASSKQGTAIVEQTTAILQTFADAIGEVVRPVAPVLPMLAAFAKTIQGLIIGFMNMVGPLSAFGTKVAQPLIAGIVGVVAGIEWVVQTVANGFSRIATWVLELVDEIPGIDLGDQIDSMRGFYRDTGDFGSHVRARVDSVMGVDVVDSMQSLGVNGTDDVYRANDGLASSADGASRALDSLSDSAYNLPAGFKLAGAQYGAQDAGRNVVGGGITVMGDINVSTDSEGDLSAQIEAVGQARRVGRNGSGMSRIPGWAIAQAGSGA